MSETIQQLLFPEAGLKPYRENLGARRERVKPQAPQASATGLSLDQAQF
jgi:hypothetical protein